MPTRLRMRAGTAAEWAAEDPVLALSEFGHVTDTDEIYVGDGATAWSALSPWTPGGAGVSDLDDLTDVDLTGQADGDFLSRVAGVWTPVDAPAGGSAPTFQGVRVKRSADVSIATSTASATSMAWDTETFDTDGFHEGVTNPSRFTVPAGMGGYYRVEAHFTYNESTTAGYRIASFLYKNGVLLPGTMDMPNGFAGPRTVVHTEVMLLAAGDYIQASPWHNAGSNRDVESDDSFFLMHLIGV